LFSRSDNQDVRYDFERAVCPWGRNTALFDGEKWIALLYARVVSDLTTQATILIRDGNYFA